MVRETRHLWVGNLPDNIREDRIREHFKRYGRVQSVKLLPRATGEEKESATVACTVAFMDIKSASKAHNAELKLDDRLLSTEYYEPQAVPSGAGGGDQDTAVATFASASPGGTARFPNGHSSAADDHWSSRNSSSASSDDFLRRGYHDSTRHDTASSSRHDASSSRHDTSSAATNRRRSRERTDRYRTTNGPSYLESGRVGRASGGGSTGTSSGSGSWSSYESTRYNSGSSSQADTGYSTTPSDSTERRSSDQSSKKKTKSRSGSRSASPSGSTSSRSPSRSRSRSSSTSSSSSSTSSSTTPKSRRTTANATTNHQPASAADERSSDDHRTTSSTVDDRDRAHAICVRNLPLRSSDTSLKDGLFHEYKKHGKVTLVKVVGQNSERHAIVCFKKAEDVEKALEVSYDKLFFGCKIEVAPYQGYDVEDTDLRPYEAEIDEYHPKATRTLFIGNLEKDVTASDLRKHFDQFGEIIEIDIKKQGAVTSYAFCQYTDITSVVKAIRKMDGEHLGNNRIKLGFGKSMPYNCVWVDGINENVNEKYLRLQFEQFGVINKVHLDRDKGQALIFYEQVLSAQTAVSKMRGFVLKNTKIQVDFASRECQESFYERLEKQGAILDRSNLFDERRETSSRSFEASAVSRFSSRYDTPSRPRTSSYSSRSSITANQVPSSMQSPGTPGSVTPRGTSSRRRYAEYYETSLDYADRHFRSYDEYSQGSAASHEDVYEHEYPFVHDSPTHIDVLDSRVVDPGMPYPDIRNLQKERVHLLEQLEECPSSGDELMSPKKRLKLDLLEAGSDVIIEANRDHRKVMEVRRLSDANLKHHSRRPSIDSVKHSSSRDISRHDIGYLPHAVCKRRKTASSDGGSRVQHYDHSGSESVGGSRPGTPLCDERPENFQPTEPRRVERREREGPLTLPLPRFAAQIMNRGSVSVAGIKGQKDVLSSPPPAVTSPRVSSTNTPRPPSPVHVPPPASPPPRPPSLISNSSDSSNDITPPSPSLEERIRSLDEKYEKWSGSRGLSAAGGDALALLDANLEKFRQRHKLLDLDLKEVQPSEIVKSVMAKRSVFDEDLKRLENVGEKYEPKEFSLYPRVSATLTTQTSVPATPLPAPPTLKLAPVSCQLPKTPTVLSPRSSGTSLPAAKGLQYPFPTHPPTSSLMSPVLQAPPTPPTPTTSSIPLSITSTTSGSVSTTTTTTRGTSHGDNRLKPCATVSSSDTRTSSKVTVNRSSVKVCEKTSSSNIPIATEMGDKANKTVRETKSSDKTSEKVSSRRDSSNSNSPRADIKTRRNSDTSARRIEETDASAKEKEQKERFEKIRLENEKLEREKLEKERIEKERLEKEKQEKERLERERLEKDRLERESELEKQRLEKERLEKERLERERQEKERLEREQLERLQKEKEERERKERERKDREDREKREREEKERREREEKERREREEKEKKEQEEKERKEREERERQEKEKEEQEKKEREERERIEKEKQEKAERDRKREEERSRHKEDNHEKRNDHKHREIHSETKHRDNHIDKHLYTKESSKEDKLGVHELLRRDSHDSRSGHEKSKHHSERESERRKDSIKENRDNNTHEKHKFLSIESRHLSIDLDKNKFTDSSKIEPKKKERNNSLPANIGSKRRVSSHESVENTDENKKIKLSHEHKKLSERRDSRDSNRSEEKSKIKHKNNTAKLHDKHNSKDGEEKRKDKDKDKEERHKKHKLEKLKSKSKSREKDSQEGATLPKSPLSDKDFLARLELRSTEEVEKQRREKDVKSKSKDGEEKEVKTVDDKSKKEKQDKSQLIEKQKDVNLKIIEEKRRRERPRKPNSSGSDSDEPKKHSIFDIVDDEPAYISMYDKVKARSCKNMAKQEEEKRQEKIKAKFSQLKQSRAKREEKKRSTSWDEDSDSDREHTEIKVKRCPKMLIDSSDDESQERKPSKKKDVYSDSDSSAVLRPIKQEPIDTSDDEVKNKHLILKPFKSRITEDISEDECSKNKIEAHVKTEIFSDVENVETPAFSEVEEKPQLAKVKEELGCLVKKERRNSKHQESSMDTSSQQIFSDMETKSDKFSSRHSLGENSSDEETHELSKKERREKKHKKKQKKQRHSLSAEDLSKLEELGQTENTEKSKHHEKKKEHSKKEKRRDKNREGREKSKKSKKNKSENKSDGKRDGKMENIFGSLSDDSENGAKDIEPQEQKSNVFIPDESQQPSLCNSESEREHESKIKEKSEKERDREEHRRKKEKKRREKERRLQEAAAAAAAIEQASNENSMDFADMGKQLEENMLRDDSLDANERINKDIENTFDNVSNDPFKFTNVSDLKKEKEERREGKEKKKKRKKSKEEKSKHHHHHHHEKNKTKSSDTKKEILSTSQTEEESNTKIEADEPCKSQDPSLPSLMDDHSPISSQNITPDFNVSPLPGESQVLSPIPKTPTSSKEKNCDKFIPGFGSEIDEKIHESAVQSISEFEIKKEEVVVKEEDCQPDKNTELTEDKPRAVISQEETEDAVAALLGESFGGNACHFEESYEDEINSSGDQPSSLAEETNVQDDEEMRQAVQSLSATELDVKPDTPQSEHELQIDTDTEEQEEIPLRFDQPPKTPDLAEISQPPKTSNISTYYQNPPEEKTVHTPSPLVLNSTPNIGSPPSLTPIKQSTSIDEIRTYELEAKSLPLLPEQNTRSVISQSWSVEKKQESTSESPAIKPDMKNIPALSEIQPQPKIVTASPLRQYSAPSVLKVNETTMYPPLQPISRSESVNLSPATETATKVPTVPLLQPPNSPSPSQLHNLPARSPVQNSKPASDSSMLSPKLQPNLLHSRLPITPVMASKPLQATTVILQQSKVAHSLEPPKLVSASDHRPQERPRMIFQTSTIQPSQFTSFSANQPRMVLQGNIRHLPPQGLLVPTRQLPPHTYLTGLSQTPYSLSPIIKETSSVISSDKKQPESSLKVPQPVISTYNLGLSSISTQSSTVSPAVVSSSTVSHLSLQQPLMISKKEPTTKPPAPTLTSPSTISINSPKSFVPTSPSPKPLNIIVNSPSPKPSNVSTNISSPKPCNIPVNSPSLKPSSPNPIKISPSPIPKVPTPEPIENVSLPATEEATLSYPKTDKIEPEKVEDISKVSAIDPLEQKHLQVPIQEPKTSIPSPVITSILKEEVSDKQPPTESEIKSEQPTKLAIEAVTEELNNSLGKETTEIKEEDNAMKKEHLEKRPEKCEVISEIKKEPETITTADKVEIIEDSSTVIKEIEKFDEEKMETESVISDISKERSASADILAKDDPLDTKEDSDYWSAKEVNIDSVIKTLCSADELSDHSSENGKDDWYENCKSEEHTKVEHTVKERHETPEKKEEVSHEESKSDESEIRDVIPEPEKKVEEQKEPILLRSSTRSRTIRGRGGRGKTRTQVERGGIQTRRGKLAAAVSPPTPTKRGRGGRAKSERKSIKSETETTPTDIYEFRDEPDDTNKEQRPRLILTIKSPAVSNNSSAQTTATVKEVTKDGAKEIGKEQPKEHQPVVSKTVETKEEFAPPAVTNTRKSRRLQEKDISRNTVDDTIEDVVKNTVQTRASSNQRRSARQSTPKQVIVPSETARKSPRGRKARRGSEATENSSSEETCKEESKEPPTPPKEIEKPKEPEKEIETVNESKEKPIEGLKAAVLRRIRGEISSPTQHEPTNLIDPVTGELIPMRECEEGKYIPLPGSKLTESPKVEAPASKELLPPVTIPEPSELKPSEIIKPQPTVIAQPQPINIIQPPKPQCFKTHILASQAAQAAQLSTITQQLPPSTTVQIKTHVPVPSAPPQIVNVVGTKTATQPAVPPYVSKPITPVVISKSVTPIVATKIATPIVSKPVTPINQHLNINTSMGGMNVVSSTHLSPRPNMPLGVVGKSAPKQLVKPPVLSPILAQKQQQQILQQAAKQQQQIAKSHLVTPICTSQAQIVNTQLAHMKPHQPVLKQQVIIGKGPIIKSAHPAHLHQQQMLAAAVPSPPLSKSQTPLGTSRIIQGPNQLGPKGIMDPPKVDVSMANVMLGQRPKLSPQGPQQRLISQAGIPIPGYEASLHGERSLLNRSRSPPPAHQNSPSPKGETIAHFPPGPLRPPPDLNPAHYMHPSHVMQYQQYLRQQQLHLSRSGGLEKVGDGQEGEEAPVTSPPLELRRPGSVGLALTGRGTSVPHSLHSPHDRATDSPLVGQVHNVHSARMQHYHSSRYYDQAEPPPAHCRQLPSSLAALGSHLPDRPIGSHMSPLPDRPLSGHTLTAHMGAQTAHMGGHIERPLSTHGLMGATLGAAGNLMGAVARHIGADAPTTQRGLQAATPPHASQVPPQAESLFMLLKQYPCMWQGLLALKNDQAAVQMYFVSGNDDVAKCSLPKNTDGSTPPLRIFQRMRLEQPQVEGVARKMQMENEHCMLLALPCGHDHMDVLKQSTNLTHGFITYLQHKQAAGIVNVAAPGTTQPPAYVVHIFPSCDFVNENLRRIAPSLLERVADIAHLLIVITTV